MKINYVTRSTFFALPLFAFFALAGAACGTAPETGANTNTARTNANAPAASPTMTTNNGNADDMQAMSGMDHSTMKSSPNAAGAPYDLQFMDTMIAHHQGAIDMARPAGAKAQHNELKEMARNIIRDQEREINQMKEWRERWFKDKPQAMNMEMSGMTDSMKGMDMNRLNNASGGAFDLMFIDMMTPHHQGAIVMAREALTRAERPEIKRIAQQIITEQEREIAQMNKWKAAWSDAGR